MIYPTVNVKGLLLVLPAVGTWYMVYYEGTILLDIRGKHKRGANVQRASLSSWTLHPAWKPMLLGSRSSLTRRRGLRHQCRQRERRGCRRQQALSRSLCRGSARAGCRERGAPRHQSPCRHRGGRRRTQVAGWRAKNRGGTLDLLCGGTL